MSENGKWAIKTTEPHRFDPTIGHRCPHPGCKVQVVHVHNEQGRLIWDSIDWEYLDSLSDNEMKKAIGGDIGAFHDALTPTETNR